MAQTLRNEVLKAFKLLHRTRTTVFKGDTYALETTRQKINEEFKKNKNVTVESSIEELLKLSRDVENELRTKVVQAKEKEPGVYELIMRPEVKRLKNATSCTSSEQMDEKPTGKCRAEKIE